MYPYRGKGNPGGGAWYTPSSRHRRPNASSLSLVAPASYGDVQKELLSNAAQLKKNNATTLFSVMSATPDMQRQAVVFNGQLSTWIGEPDKNRAWDLLVSAKQHYDRGAEQLARDPARAAAGLARLDDYMRGSDVRIHVSLGIADGTWTVYGCDLSDGYVRINADYTT